MKYIVNILLFLITIYSLTVMPIDMKALQVDVSWEKYKAIEEKKETEKQQEAIQETVQTSTYQLTYSGESYLFNPSEIKLSLSGDDKLPDLITDVCEKLTFEWVNTASGETQLLSVPAEAVTVGQVLGTTETSAEIQVRLATLTQITDGQYRLIIRSQSELTKDNPDIQLDLSWFKKSVYAPYEGSGFSSGVAVTYYYPTADGNDLIPVTESVANSKVLRKIANRLFAGQTENTDLKTGPLVPRIRNIQLKSGTLSLYTTASDVETAKAAGLAPEQMTTVLSKTFFSLPYVKEVVFYLDGKPADANLNPSDSALPILRSTAVTELYHPVAVGRAIYFVTSPAYFSSAEQLIQLLSAEKSRPELHNAIGAVPGNLEIRTVPDLENPKRLTLDLAFEAELYGGDAQLTRLLLDTLALNLSRAGLTEELLFTVNGQPVSALNGVDLTKAYSAPALINVKAAN